MPNIPSLKEMLEAGMHFGHRTEHWHPKMGEYIFGTRNGVHVIDIEQTQTALENLHSYVKTLVSNGGSILFASTKLPLQSIVREHAEAAGMPYVTERWIGGTFTNFAEIKKLIHTYLDLKERREKGDLKKYTKLEQLQFDRKIDELEKKIGGISQLKKLPEAVIVFDIRSDKTIITEATKQGIKTVGVCDTNVNPDLVDVVIPANDDSLASVTLIMDVLVDAAKEGKKAVKPEVKAPAKKGKKEDDVRVKADSKEVVEELDDKVKDSLVKEKEEGKTK